MQIMKTLKAGWVGAVLLAACGQTAEPDSRSYAEVLNAEGLAGAVSWAESQASAPEQAFLNGMTEALLGIEHVLQVRYQTYSGELPIVPGGQALIRYNPDAEFDPAFVERAMLGALEHFARADAALENATGEDFAVEVDLADFWFDVDGDGARGEGEDALSQIGLLLGQRSGAMLEDTDTVVRFDTADADWLAAYVNVASASAELILSVDPTSAIEAVYEGNQKIEALGLEAARSFFGDARQIDSIAVVLTALDGAPDATRTRAALGHLKAMIAHNQNFWALVEEETDNDREWLPNAEQVSAFGVEVSEATAASWQAVLAEMSAVLEGEKLMPHWRFQGRGGASYGINIESLLNEPGDFDLVLMLHGASLAPHFEQGELANPRVWRQFTRTVPGSGNIFALWLN